MPVARRADDADDAASLPRFESAGPATAPGAEEARACRLPSARVGAKGKLGQGPGEWASGPRDPTPGPPCSTPTAATVDR
jgi:hypothetical protein